MIRKDYINCLRKLLNYQKASKEQLFSTQQASYKSISFSTLPLIQTQRSYWFSTQKMNKSELSTHLQGNITNNQNVSADIKCQYVELLKRQNYSFRILTKAHQKEAAELIFREFRASEPLMNAYLRMYPESESYQGPVVRKLWQTWMEHSCENNMSVGIHDTDSNNELIGVLAVKDYLFEPENLYEKYLKDKKLNMFGSALQLYTILIQKADSISKMQLQKPHNVADLWGGAITRKHVGKNLLSEMIKLNEMLARQEGYNYAFTFATSFKTQKALRRLNYKMLSQINAKQTVCFDVFPFQFIDSEQNYPSIWLKNLS